MENFHRQLGEGKSLTHIFKTNRNTVEHFFLYYKHSVTEYLVVHEASSWQESVMRVKTMRSPVSRLTNQSLSSVTSFIGKQYRSEKQ